MAVPELADDAPERQARRDFLIRCSRSAGATPPAMTTLLAVSGVPRQTQGSITSRGRGQGRGGRTIVGYVIDLPG